MKLNVGDSVLCTDSYCKSFNEVGEIVEKETARYAALYRVVFPPNPEKYPPGNKRHTESYSAWYDNFQLSFVE